jgi:hypothetical protein
MTLSYRHETKVVSRNLAAKLLNDLNHGNRKVVEPHVWSLAKEMASGVFNLNPQPIIIREDKKKASLKLLDGQHRLHAAKRKAPSEGVPMLFCYVLGNDAEITTLQNTIDSGKPRTTTDRGGFQGFGIPQNFLERAARLFTVIGQAVDDTDTSKGVYGWMNAPKASYSLCKVFAENQMAALCRADQLASDHCKDQFKPHRIHKQYLALAYLVALMNGTEVDDLYRFAGEAARPNSTLSCKLHEVWREGHDFAIRLSKGTANASGIQYLLIRDLLVDFLNGQLTNNFQPVLDTKRVDDTTFTDFDVI